MRSLKIDHTPAGKPSFDVCERHAFLAIAALILISRLVFTLTFPIAQISDYSGYFEGAQRLAGLKEGALGSWDPVGPKLLYAPLLRLFGPDLRVLGVTNSFVFLAGVVFLYRGARRAFDAPTAVLSSPIICRRRGTRPASI